MHERREKPESARTPGVRLGGGGLRTMADSELALMRRGQYQRGPLEHRMHSELMQVRKGG